MVLHSMEDGNNVVKGTDYETTVYSILGEPSAAHSGEHAAGRHAATYFTPCTFLWPGAGKGC